MNWISVKDRLPDNSGDYLIVSDGGVYVDRYVSDYMIFMYPDQNNEQDLHVTHWMPLPEPPSGEE